MKLIHVYTTKEFLGSFIFGLLVFSSILLIDQLFQLVNLFLGKGVSLYIIVKLFALVLPNIFTLTIPMATLFGVLLAYGRLSEDNEITAMRSTGFGYSVFTAHILAFIFCMGIFLGYFNQNMVPATHNQFRQIYKEILKRRPLVKFEEKAITSLDEYRIYVDKVDKKNSVLKGVNIYKFSITDDPNSSNWRISAQDSFVSVTANAIVFNLYNGYWQKPNPSLPQNLVHMKFSGYRFAIPLGEKTIPLSQSLKEMKGSQLREEIRNYKAKKLPTQFLETEYWLRWILAFAPFVFAFVGMPLGISLEKGTKSISFGLSLLIIFGYYLLLITGLNIGEKGFISPQFILWLPNITMFSLGIYLWHRMLKR